jgi:gliding motility-associated-like protein
VFIPEDVFIKSASMRFVYLFAILGIYNSSIAQQSLQHVNWMVGATPVGPNAPQTPGPSLNFIDCDPNVQFNASGLQFEGQTAISDIATGALLFYSNGNQVRNALGQIMPNGNQVGTSNSMAQNLIVKQPGGGSTYYLFTPETQAGTITNTLIPGLNGFSYSIIDMSLDGGLGAVVSSANLLMPLGNCEMVTGVYHQNGEDIWIIGHQYASNTFFTFLLTASGISSGPILSSVGPTILTFQPGIYANSNYDAIGELKASPDGNKLAFTTFYNGYTCLFDFNSATGEVSNPIELNLGSAGYGTSFSQDNSKLYFSRVDATQGGIYFLNNGSVVQFDLSSNDPASIQSSMTVIFSSATGFRSLKLGPDGKIYIARTTLVNGGNGASFLAVINNPDETGLACNFVNDGVFIGANNGRWGLNNVIEDFFSCADFDFSLGPDINICPESSVTLNAPPNELSYLWNTGATSSSITVSEPGTYWVSVTSTNGTASDTIVVSNFVPQNININGELGVCPGNTTDLAASNGFTNYQWNTGEVTQNITVSAGTYWLTANDPNGCLTSDTVSVFEFPSPTITISGNTSVCVGDETTLQVNSGFVAYQWSNGSNEATANLGVGTYSITVIDSLGCSASSEITVVSSSPTAGIALNSNFINLENSLNLQSTSSADLFPINTWNWTFGDGNTSDVENPSHNYSAVGNYIITLVITDALGCTDTTFVEIEVLGAFVIPNVVTPNGDGVNDVFFIQNLDLSQANTLVVFNRWGNVVFEVENYQNDWQPNNLVDGVYFYQFTLSQSETKQGFFHVYSGE